MQHVHPTIARKQVQLCEDVCRKRTGMPTEWTCSNRHISGSFSPARPFRAGVDAFTLTLQWQNQLGIELTPTACRIVELDDVRARDGRPRDTRVISFSVLPPSGPETTARLATLRGRTAAVVRLERAARPSPGDGGGRIGIASRCARASCAAVVAAQPACAPAACWADIAPARRARRREARRAAPSAGDRHLRQPAGSAQPDDAARCSCSTSMPESRDSEP